MLTGIIALDDRNGYSLFGKRLSKDRKMLEDMTGLLEDGQCLYVSQYSLGIFSEELRKYLRCPVPDNFTDDGMIFFEAVDFSSFSLDMLIVYRWNRYYPSDVKYNPYLHGWKKVSSYDFSGYSHEKITREVYER